MKSKPFSLFLFTILLALLMSSCSPAQVTELPSQQPATTTTKPEATATETPALTEISGPTEISPTAMPQIELIGIVPMEEFPSLTHAQALAHFEEAIRLSQEPNGLTYKVDANGYGNTTFEHQYSNGPIYGKKVRFGCFVERGGCKVLDSFQFPTESGTNLRMVLVEMAVQFADGTTGPVVYPIIMDYPTFVPGGNIDQHTVGSIYELNQQADKGIVEFHFSVEHLIKSKNPINPGLREVIAAQFAEGSRSQGLLTKMYDLADKQRSLTQDELRELFGLLTNF